MVGGEKRNQLYGERGEGDDATRMICGERFKLIYYPVGNRIQLFDLREDPGELRDLSGDPNQADKLERLSDALVGQMYGSDTWWIDEGRLVGEPDKIYTSPPNRGLSGWHGLHWPPRVTDE